MGYFHKELVSKAGEIVWDHLRKNPTIRFSDIYNDAPGTMEQLETALGGEGGIGALDIAIHQICIQRLANSNRQVESKLIDGESDYEIALTPLGCRKISDANFHPEFLGVDA